MCTCVMAIKNMWHFGAGWGPEINIPIEMAQWYVWYCLKATSQPSDKLCLVFELALDLRF